MFLPWVLENNISNMYLGMKALSWCKSLHVTRQVIHATESDSNNMTCFIAK